MAGAWSGGGDTLKSLLSLEDVVGLEDKKRKVELEKKIDSILDFAGDFDLLGSYFDTKIREDIDPPALKYFAGYVVRKAKKCTSAKTCQSCFDHLLAPKDQQDNDDDLIDLRSHGHLFKPSDQFMDLIYRLEMAVLTAQQNQNISRNILFEGKFAIK